MGDRSQAPWRVRRIAAGDYRVQATVPVGEEPVPVELRLQRSRLSTGWVMCLPYAGRLQWIEGYLRMCDALAAMPSIVETGYRVAPCGRWKR